MVWLLAQTSLGRSPMMVPSNAASPSVLAVPEPGPTVLQRAPSPQIDR
jgi:hypothetical protein